MSQINITCRKATCDPITYRATATVEVNGKVLEGSYSGDENECRREVKEGAVTSLRAKCRKAGMTV